MIIQGTAIKGMTVSSSAAGITSDSYFNLVSLLLPGNGTNGAQNNTFLDSSTNNFTVTRNGNTTQGTFSPFSQTGWSVFVNSAGSSTSTMKGLTTPNSTLFDMVNGGTVECWVYLTQYPAAGAPYFNSAFLFSFYGAAFPAGSKYYGMSIVNTGALSIIRNYGGSLSDNTSSTIIPLNTWTHIAWSRISGSNYFFVNGTDITSTFTDPTLSGAWPAPTTDYQLYIGLGAYLYNVYTYIGDFNGYISNFRVVKGSAVYSASFTPPTQPLTAVSGTSLLTCQSNRYIDNSTNALAITPLNTPSVQPFSPFNPDAAYSTTSVGGSGYFDTVGDYLSINDASNLASPGSGDFTAECWLYVPSLPSNALGASAVYHLKNDTGTSTTVFIIEITSGGALNLSTGTSLIAVGTSSRVIAGAWNHLVVSRLSGTLRSFINGTADISVSNSTTYNGSVVQIGAWRYEISDFSINGYIGGFRFQKGSGYSSVTVPTAPLTAITNTSLLLDFTNGGIIDNTAKNNLETVGGASISTTLSKFGGSSMYFDGTGDYLYRPYSPLFALGTGDFTIEWWMNPDSSQNSTSAIFYFFSGGSYFIAHNNLTAYPNLITVYVDNYGSGTRVLTGTTTLSSGTWYHVAITRYSGVWNLYVNGVLQGSTYTNSAEPVPSSAALYIGSGQTGYKGYLQDFRITKGYARYTANFTPPTAAFPTQ